MRTWGSIAGGGRPVYPDYCVHRAGTRALRDDHVRPRTGPTDSDQTCLSVCTPTAQAGLGPIGEVPPLGPQVSPLQGHGPCPLLVMGSLGPRAEPFSIFAWGGSPIYMTSGLRAGANLRQPRQLSFNSKFSVFLAWRTRVKSSGKHSHWRTCGKSWKGHSQDRRRSSVYNSAHVSADRWTPQTQARLQWPCQDWKSWTWTWAIHTARDTASEVWVQPQTPPA